MRKPIPIPANTRLRGQRWSHPVAVMPVNLALLGMVQAISYLRLGVPSPPRSGQDPRADAAHARGGGDVVADTPLRHDR